MLQFLRLIGIIILSIGGSLFALLFIVFPLGRYICCRIILFFRFLFSKAAFSEVGLLRCVIPHFGSKPDLLLLSGTKLYMIKLISFRKTNKTVIFTSDKYWQVENLVGSEPSDNDGAVGEIIKAIHKVQVFSHKHKAPDKLATYANKINKALAGEEIDCIPVYLFNPGVKQLQTAQRVNLINGDTVFYGVIAGNGFYPEKIKAPAISRKKCKEIIKTAKKTLREKLPKERTVEIQ